MAIELTPNALAVLQKRYLARDGDVVETPAQMFERVAHHVAAAEARWGARPPEVAAIAARFASMMSSLDFLPNSPTLMNAGRPLGQLAACFVVPVGDSTRDIFEAVRWAAEIQKTGGGTGFAFSRLRPAGDGVASTGGIAAGPVAFMQVFDVATEAIKQGGTRRGANMGILRVDHPDVLEFISLKLDPARMRNFNLSLAITDTFMAAVERGGDYALINPRTGGEVRRLDARTVLELAVNAAWAVGDPGLVFIDRINDAQPTPALGAIEATNPCGEQPLLPFESCTLGSIHLGRFAKDADVDRNRLRGVVRDAVRFLDDVIEVNHYPLPEIEAATRATRKLGLGVMGWADLLIELEIPYDSERALTLAGEIAELVETESIEASVELAKERGSFPAWDGSRWQLAGQAPLRNATTTTVAPTGTISIIAGCSSGIEPLYALAYERHVLDGAVLPEVNPAFRRVADAHGLWSDELAARIAAHGSVADLPIPEALRSVFVTAHDVSIEGHVRMQAAFQRHVHAAVSKTINLRRDASPDDVRRAYLLAYQLGCKGITVYRDGSREGQVLTFTADTVDAPAVGPACPECTAPLVVHARCSLCRSCGWSVCR